MTCRACLGTVCSCTDLAFAGLVPPALDQCVYPERRENRPRISDALSARRIGKPGMVERFHAHLQPLDESRNHG